MSDNINEKDIINGGPVDEAAEAAAAGGSAAPGAAEEPAAAADTQEAACETTADVSLQAEEAAADVQEAACEAETESYGEAEETAADGSGTEKKKKEKKPNGAAVRFKNSFKTKNFKFGMYSSALTAVVIAAVIVINLLAAHLPSSLSAIDLSSADLYSIGSQTEELLDSLDEDITISVLAAEDSADENIDTLLAKYEKASDHITVKYVDTTTDLGASETYSSYSANSIVVACGDKESVIDYYDIYQQDYSDYYTTGQISTSFDGEGQITGAINKVTSEGSQTLYFLTGHGETEISSSVSSMISKQNMLTSDMNLLAQDIPDDCSAVIINGATDDLSSDEATKLNDYIKSGGNVMILLTYTENEQPNLDSVMNAYGVQRAGGIVMETSDNCYNYQINIISGIESTDITEDLVSDKANIIFTNTIALTTTDLDGVTATTLLKSSDGAYAKVPQNGQLTTLEKESGDIDGPFDFAVMSEDDAEGGKLAVIASETMIEDMITQQLPVANLEFFVSCLTDMCGEGDTAAISIDAKSMDVEYLTISALHSMIWMAVCVILIPLAIFVTGLVIWLVRRKR